MSNRIKSDHIFKSFENKLAEWRKEQSDKLPENIARLDWQPPSSNEQAIGPLGSDPNIRPPYTWTYEMPDTDILMNMLIESNEEAKADGKPYFYNIDELIESEFSGEDIKEGLDFNQYFTDNQSEFINILENNIKESSLTNSLANVYVNNWSELKDAGGLPVMDQYPPGSTGLREEYSYSLPQRFKTSGHLGPGAFYGPTADMIYESGQGSPNYVMTEDEAKEYYSPENMKSRADFLKDFYTTGLITMLSGGTGGAIRSGGRYLSRFLPSSLKFGGLSGIGTGLSGIGTGILRNPYTYTKTGIAKALNTTPGIYGRRFLNTFVNPIAGKSGNLLPYTGYSIVDALLKNRLATAPMYYSLARGIKEGIDPTDTSPSMYGPVEDVLSGFASGAGDYYYGDGESPIYKYIAKPSADAATDVGLWTYDNIILPIAQWGGDEELQEKYEQEVKNAVTQQHLNLADKYITGAPITDKLGGPVVEDYFSEDQIKDIKLTQQIIEDAKKAAAEEYKKKYEAKIVPSQTDTTKTDTIFKRKYNINFRENFLN